MDATSAPGSPRAPVSLMGFKFKVSLYIQFLIYKYIWLARNIHIVWTKIQKMVHTILN